MGRKGLKGTRPSKQNKVYISARLNPRYFLSTLCLQLLCRIFSDITPLPKSATIVSTILPPYVTSMLSVVTSYIQEYDVSLTWPHIRQLLYMCVMWDFYWSIVRAHRSIGKNTFTCIFSKFKSSNLDTIPHYDRLLYPWGLTMCVRVALRPGLH